MGKLMAKLQIVVLTPYFPPRRHRSGSRHTVHSSHFQSHVRGIFPSLISCSPYLIGLKSLRPS
jgi:hypothetical protein